MSKASSFQVEYATPPSHALPFTGEINPRALARRGREGAGEVECRVLEGVAAVHRDEVTYLP